MAPLIEMKANQNNYLGGGGVSAIPSEMTRCTALEAAKTTHPARPIVHLTALIVAALALLAPRPRVKNLGPLS